MVWCGVVWCGVPKASLPDEPVMAGMSCIQENAKQVGPDP